MDTFKLFVFVLTNIALISIQTNVDAALGTDCSTDTSVCETSNNEICSGTTCVCGNAFYESGTLCAAINTLTPTALSSPSQTSTSISLTWTSPEAPGYTNSYIINYYVEGESTVQSQTVNGQDQFTTVQGLSAGTTYTFTIARFITKEGQPQQVPASASIQATTSTPKGYDESCTAGSTDECGTGLICAVSFNKCLCADGSYYNGTNCSSNDALKPVDLQSNTKTHNSVTLTWTSPDAAGYTNSYSITYNQEGTPQTHYVNGQDTFTTVPNLDPGTIYSFTVVRSIIREGRTQTVPTSDLFIVITNGLYYDSCTAVGDSAECGPGLVCVSGAENRCRCTAGNFYTGSMCASTDALKPTLTSTSQTTTEVSLTWTSPNANDFTNSYIIKYNVQGGSPLTYDVDQSTAATVPNLNPGTTYSFIVVRSIIRHGRTQTVESDDLVQSTQKLGYDSVCTGNQCQIAFSCIQGKCLCADENYYIDDSCVSITTLKPLITGTQPTSTSSVTITWNSPATSIEYTNSHVIKYTEEGTTDVQTSPVLGDVSTYLVTGLKAGTSYTFIVARSITRQGRTQTVDSMAVDGESEKINYGESCVSTGTCKTLNANCYSSVCSCDFEHFWKDPNCLTNANLIPGSINTETLSTTQLRVTWTAPSYPDVVTGYLVELSPPVSSENIIIPDTSVTISSLTPGERYNVTVSSRSSYLNRGETAAAGVVKVTMKPATTSGLTPATSLMAPVAEIHFNKADGRADSYTVTLTRDGYNRVEPATGGSLTANFSGVLAGLYYNVTIITNSYGVSSDPFTQRIRVRAEASEAVVGLSASGVTSRGASLTWKRPVNTKGALYKYGIEVFNSSTCVQRINIVCAVCKDSMNVSETSESSCKREPDTVISQSNLNNVNFPVPYALVLLPDTVYDVFVAAYNEEGKGTTSKENVMTQQEAPGDPTEFLEVSKTSESVELRWNPPEPRPGVTAYNISVYEWDENSKQYKSFIDTDTLGFYNVSVNITGLSSYWKYRFEMYARTSKNVSNTVNGPEVTTEESAPTAVENLEHQAVDGVYNQYQLSWRCPPQKDGRNGLIRIATVITSSITKSVDLNPETGQYNFTISNCTWNEKIEVTPEFNYTFEVYISNSMKGESTTIQQYMPAGPASLSRTSLPADKQKDSSDLKTIPIVCCPSCILDRKNGKITSSGIIVCKGSCNKNRRKRQTRTEADYEKFQTWGQAQRNSFNTPHRTTPPEWLSRFEGSISITYVIGNNTKCTKETSFCNGPLEEGTNYKIFAFACTEVGCDETEEISISTAVTPTNNIGGIIGGAVGALAAIIVVIIVVIVVMKRRARPTTKKQRQLEEPSDDEELIVKKRPVQVNNFEKRVEEMHRDSNLLFSEEFEDINALSPKEKCIASETDGNKLKNRYVNILPFDGTRVKLRQTEEDEEETDYINANYIPGYSSPREYIATQGPMTGTIIDFWRMIWEQNVPIIIMLSDLQEKGKPKVDRYYPENMEPVQYGDIVLEMTNFSPLNKYVIRIFKLQVGEEVRMVRHYFLPGWQDFGANLNSDDVIDFVKNVRREIKPNNTGPMCVHCSAGVGRTGTYIALDVFQQHIDEEKMDKELDIFDFVLKMRHNRSYMVQTEKQYIFIHDTIKEMVIKKKKEIAERDNIYMNNETTNNEDLYVNHAFEADTQDIYMNVDTSGKPTTVL